MIRAAVNFAAETATVDYLPSMVTPDDLAAAVEKAGFGALIRHDGETGAGFTGPRRFHRCIQRQQVCLKSDFIDILNNFNYFVVVSLDLRHFLSQLNKRPQ